MSPPPLLNEAGAKGAQVQLPIYAIVHVIMLSKQ